MIQKGQIWGFFYKSDKGKLKSRRSGDHKFFFITISKLISILSGNKYSTLIKPFKKMIKLAVSVPMKA